MYYESKDKITRKMKTKGKNDNVKGKPHFRHHVEYLVEKQHSP